MTSRIVCFHEAERPAIIVPALCGPTRRKAQLFCRTKLGNRIGTGEGEVAVKRLALSLQNTQGLGQGTRRVERVTIEIALRPGT